MTDDKTKARIQKHKRRRTRSRRKRRSHLRMIPMTILALLAITIVVFLVLTLGGNSKKKDKADEFLPSPQIEEIPEEPEVSMEGNGVIEHILKAAIETEKAFGLRPEEVDLNDENREDFVKITRCEIGDGGYVNINLESQGVPASDDKFFYLFEIKGYDDNPTLGTEYISKFYKNESVSTRCLLNANSPNSRLYKKFGVAVKKGDEYQLVSIPKFVTNPEAIARHNNVFMNPGSKKGILIDYNRLYTGQLEDLGVKQIAMNIPVASILGPTSNALFPSVHYTYNGRNYTFNGCVLSGFDSTISALTSKGISTTVILLNTYSNAYNDLIHPDARKQGVCPYYMFNGSTDDGVELLAAVGSFLADRYSGDKHGRVSNWVIANEINARKEWNYLNYTDVDTYSKEYAKAFRVLYTAIKSTSSTARVLISLDQTWDRNLSNSPDYDGKDVLDSFNDYVTKTGNINWSIAYHPYNVPLTSTKTWAASKYISHSVSTPMISMQNIEVLVNYMNQNEFLAPDGTCRSIMITELGYTSTAGEQNQAAAIAYAYYKIDYYKDIDALLLNRQTDDATEIAQGLATGITTAGGSHKYSYNVFKYMDTSQRESYMEFAKPIIGISDWKQIIY